MQNSLKMKCLIGLVVSLIFLVFFVGCNDKDEGASAPSNLVLQTDISTDGSGNVVFTATADNAVSYDFEFGNGEIKTGTNGKVNYQYSLTGTHTYPVTVTAKSSDGLTAKKTVDITVTVKSSGNLIWSEEFNTDGAPDQTKWGYDVGNGSGGWGNGELQYYTIRSQNVIVQGGVLKINAIKESYSGFQYTSARIQTAPQPRP